MEETNNTPFPTLNSWPGFGPFRADTFVI